MCPYVNRCDDVNYCRYKFYRIYKNALAANKKVRDGNSHRAAGGTRLHQLLQTQLNQ